MADLGTSINDLIKSARLGRGVKKIIEHFLDC